MFWIASIAIHGILVIVIISLSIKLVLVLGIMLLVALRCYSHYGRVFSILGDLGHFYCVPSNLALNVILDNISYYGELVINIMSLSN